MTSLVKNIATINLLIYILLYFSFANNGNEECTIGVAAGRATADGRPLVWKTRDYLSHPDNEVYYNTNYRYKFISVVKAGQSYVKMGVNEKGLAIVNSTSNDLDDGSTIGMGASSLMRYVLGTCATMTDMEHVLDSTNITGRQTYTNIAVIDSCGAAAIFETSGHQYWKFDAHDSITAPDGYVLRTNFSVNGGGTAGIERYNRTCDLIDEYYSGDSLSYKSILRYQMRDFSDSSSDPVAVPFPDIWSPSSPFGYIYTTWSICRNTSVSAAIIQGILPGEPAGLSTMWTLLGQPATSIFVPYWSVGNVPQVANSFPTAPLCDVANQIKSILFDYTPNPIFIDSYKLLDGNGSGIWTETFPAEDSILAVAESKLAQWRVNPSTQQEMLFVEDSLAGYAKTVLDRIYGNIISSVNSGITDILPQSVQLRQNYPNPFNSSTIFKFTLPQKQFVELSIYNLLGMEVAHVARGNLNSGEHTFIWNGTNTAGQRLASGFYFYRIKSEKWNLTKKLLILN